MRWHSPPQSFINHVDFQKSLVPENKQIKKNPQRAIRTRPRVFIEQRNKNKMTRGVMSFIINDSADLINGQPDPLLNISNSRPLARLGLEKKKGVADIHGAVCTLDLCLA